MEEQRKNSYDPNEDIVDRMWKRSKNSINLVIVVCNILVFLARLYSPAAWKCRSP